MSTGINSIRYDCAMSSPDVNLSFGEWLEDQIFSRGLTQVDLANAIGTSQSTVSAWVNNESVPRARSCDAIADALGIDRNEVRRRAGRRPVSEREGDIVLRPMPAIVEIRARSPKLSIGPGPVGSFANVPIVGALPADSSRWTYGIGDTFPVPSSLVRDLATPRLYIVSGDCMEPRIQDGDLVILDSRAEPQPGDAVAVRIGDDHTLKEWWPEDDDRHVLLRAIKSGYAPIRLDLRDENNEVLGVVKAWFRYGKA